MAEKANPNKTMDSNSHEDSPTESTDSNGAASSNTNDVNTNVNGRRLRPRDMPGRVDENWQEKGYSPAYAAFIAVFGNNFCSSDFIITIDEETKVGGGFYGKAYLVSDMFLFFLVRFFRLHIPDHIDIF